MQVRKLLLPLLILFLIVNSFAILFRSKLLEWGFDQTVLIVGNLFIFSLTLFSFWMLRKGLHAVSTHAFIRSVYGSFIIKLFAGAGILILYAFLSKSQINKPSIFTCMFLYLLYTFLEVNILMKLAKPKKNA